MSSMESLFLYQYTKNELQAAMEACNANLEQSLLLVSKFENQYASFQNVRYALACCNGTMAMMEAMWACGVEKGDEVIAPAMTYWASVFPALSLGAKINYVDIDPHTLCIDHSKIEEQITSKTKVIVVVHLYGYPCPMNEIMEIARQHHLYVIEDFSHAHGATYYNKLCGSIGDISIASCMREKPLPLVEGGVICTNNQTLYERCCAFGHYRYLGHIENGIRHTDHRVSNTTLAAFAGTSIGGVKNRMNPVSAALGIEILKHYPSHIDEVYNANSYFMELLEESGMFVGHRIQENGCTMGGWYMPKLFVVKGNAEQIARYVTDAGLFCYVGHKYYSLPEHIINIKHDVFQNAQHLFDLGISDLNINTRSHCSGVEETNKMLVSAPRFIRYDKNKIEYYASLYLNATKHL